MRFPIVVKLPHAAALALLGALGGCGFHLQGAGTLPPVLAKTYVVSAAPRNPIATSAAAPGPNATSASGGSSPLS